MHEVGVKPRGYRASKTVQDYLDFTWRLVDQCLVAQTSEKARLKHSWPAYDAHFNETSRKHALLRAGVREHREVTREESRLA